MIVFVDTGRPTTDDRRPMADGLAGGSFGQLLSSPPPVPLLFPSRNPWRRHWHCGWFICLTFWHYLCCFPWRWHAVSVFPTYLIANNWKKTHTLAGVCVHRALATLKIAIPYSILTTTTAATSTATSQVEEEQRQWSMSTSIHGVWVMSAVHIFPPRLDFFPCPRLDSIPFLPRAVD